MINHRLSGRLAQERYHLQGVIQFRLHFSGCLSGAGFATWRESTRAPVGNVGSPTIVDHRSLHHNSLNKTAVTFSNHQPTIKPLKNWSLIGTQSWASHGYSPVSLTCRGLVCAHGAHAGPSRGWLLAVSWLEFAWKISRLFSRE